MGRYSNNNVKVSTFSKKVNITEIEPEFQLFDTIVTHREGNFVTVVSHEYYRPSYRTRFRRAGRKNNRNANLKQEEDNQQDESTIITGNVCRNQEIILNSTDLNTLK